MRAFVIGTAVYIAIGTGWYLVFTQVGVPVKTVRLDQPPAAPNGLPPQLLVGVFWPWSIIASIANLF